MRAVHGVAAVFLLVAAWAQAAELPGSFGHYTPARQFTEHVSSTLYLPMRDGVRLAVRVTRPARDGQAAPGRFPVLWQHALTITESADSTAEPTAAGLSHLPALTAYGYVVVQVARRGNGQSFGTRRGYNDRTEDDDAYEVTEWLAAQPWSDGAVGIYGCSNTGDAAMHALSARPPHLRAVFAGCFSWSKYDAMRRGGIFAQWGTGPQRTLEEDMQQQPVAADPERHLLREAAEEHQKSTDLLALWKGLPYRDSWSPLVDTRFWAESSVSSYAAQLRQLQVPVYILGGWHDELRDQGLIALLNIPGARILIGPWKHCENPEFELLQEIHRFFDTHLKSIDTGLANEPRVHYYVMNGVGSGAWQTSGAWPVPASHHQRWYMVAHHNLASAAPSQAATEKFTVHTSVDCPQGGVGPFMQPCHIAGEGLSLTNKSLPDDLTIVGNPVVSLPVSADRPEVNLFAYLEDVAPDGQVTVITEGRLKSSLRAEAIPPFEVPGTPWHRGFAQDAELLRPAEYATLHFDLMPTAYIVRKNHRLQLTLMGADYRERARDPNTEGAVISVRSSPAEAAWLDVPVGVAPALATGQQADNVTSGPKIPADTPKGLADTPMVPADTPKVPADAPKVPADTPMGSGPHPAVMEVDASLPTHTLYHPVDLAAAGRLPVVLWGNGACWNAGDSFRWFLSDIASYGYLVIALGPIADFKRPLAPATMAPIPPGSATVRDAAKLPPPATHSSELIDALNWAVAIEAKEGHKLYHRLNTTAIAVMGQSCGGVQAIEASADPRVRTSVIWNSGLFREPTSMAGGKSLTKEDLRKLHAPTAYISGDAEDIAFVNANEDFDVIQNIPVFRAYGRGVLHTGTYGERNGGEFAGVAVGWLNWQLKGDRRARAMFVGPDCGLCVNPHWVVRARNLN